MHSIRKRRNKFAHKPGIHCDWENLETDIKIIEKSLVYFGLVQETKKLEYFAERSAMEGSDDPKIAFTRRFSYGVKEDNKIALEIAWNQNTHND